MWDVGCGMWDVRCGMWDVGCGMWNGGCGIWDVGLVNYYAASIAEDSASFCSSTTSS